MTIPAIVHPFTRRLVEECPYFTDDVRLCVIGMLCRGRHNLVDIAPDELARRSFELVT